MEYNIIIPKNILKKHEILFWLIFFTEGQIKNIKHYLQFKSMEREIYQQKSWSKRNVIFLYLKLGFFGVICHSFTVTEIIQSAGPFK